MRKIILYTVLFFPVIVNAQQLLTLKNAIDTALKNNFDIRISRNIAEMTKISNTYGMAGGLPTVNATVGDNQSFNNTSQKLSSGTETNLTDINGNSLNAGVAASMTLFNGFKIIATKEKLNYLQQQSEILLNLQIQNTMAAVMVKYYDIIRQESYLKIIQNSLDVSNKKLDIINEKDKVGMASAVDKLQAQADVNTAEQNVKLQTLVIDQDKADLLLLMNAKNNISYSIDDSIVVDPSLQLDSIIAIMDRNPQYLSAEQEIKINEQIVKEISAQRYPSIKINTAYDYAQSNYSKGNILMNQIYGPYAGVTLQIPIFDGDIYKSQKKIAELNVDNSVLQKESLLNTLSTSANKTYLSYSTTLQQIDAQQKNYELTRKLVEVVMQNFQLNQATILEVKTAQTSFEDAANLLINLKYAAKIAEIELQSLVYQLKY
jgi:outer membrane protein